MAAEGNFIEILRIEHGELEQQRSSFESIFQDEEVGNCPAAIYLSLGSSSTERSKILWSAATFARNQWTEEKMEIPTMEEFLEEKEQNDIGPPKIVVFKRAIPSFTTDGRKTRMFNFFLDIWGQAETRNIYAVLAGIASNLASCVLYSGDGELSLQDVKWLTRAASVTLKTEGEIQQIKLLLPAWKPSSEFKAGFSQGIDYISSKVTSFGEDGHIFSTCFPSKGAYLLPTDANANQEGFQYKKHMQSFCRFAFENDNRKTNNLLCEDVPSLLPTALSYQELLDFENDELLRQLLDDGLESAAEPQSQNDETGYGSGDDGEISSGSCSPIMDENLNPDVESLFTFGGGTSTVHKIQEQFAETPDTLPLKVVEDSGRKELTSSCQLQETRMIEVSQYFQGELKQSKNAEDIFDQLFSEEKGLDCVQSETSLAERIEAGKNIESTDEPQNDQLINNDELFLDLKNQFITAPVKHGVTAESLFSNLLSKFPSTNAATMENAFNILQKGFKVVSKFQQLIDTKLAPVLFLEKDEEFQAFLEETKGTILPQQNFPLFEAVSRRLEDLSEIYKQNNSKVRMAEMESLKFTKLILEEYFLEEFKKLQVSSPSPTMVQELLAKSKRAFTHAFQTNSSAFPKSFEVIESRLLYLIGRPVRNIQDSQMLQDDSKNNLIPVPSDHDEEEISENMDCNVNPNPVPLNGPRIRVPLAGLANSSNHNVGPFRAQHERMKAAGPAFVAVLFGRNKLAAYSTAQGKIYGPVANTLSISKSSSTLGQGARGDDEFLEMKNLLLQKDITRTYSYPPDLSKRLRIEAVIALILTQLHKIVLSRVKHSEVEYVIVFPTYLNMTMTNALIDSLNITMLPMTFVRQSYAILANYISKYKLNRVGVLEGIYIATYSSKDELVEISRFQRTDKYLLRIAIVDGSSNGGGSFKFFKDPRDCIIQAACQKLPEEKGKIDQTVLITMGDGDVEDFKNRVAKALKLDKRSTIFLQQESQDVCDGACILANAKSSNCDDKFLKEILDFENYSSSGVINNTWIGHQGQRIDEKEFEIYQSLVKSKKMKDVAMM